MWTLNTQLMRVKITWPAYKDRERTGDVINNCFYNSKYSSNKRRMGYLTRTSPIPPVISLHGPMGLQEDIISNSNSHDSLLSTTLHTVLFITSVSSLIKERYISYRRNIWSLNVKCLISEPLVSPNGIAIIMRIRSLFAFAFYKQVL